MTTPVYDSATTLTLRRKFPAVRERVFRAWTEREALQQWFKPGGQAVTISQLDVQVGGSYCFELGDGSDAIVGTFLEIIPPEKLVFTWSFSVTLGQETVVTVEFIDYGPTTEIILTHQRLSSEEMCENHQVGWHAMLDQLTSVLSAYSDAETRFP